jgi:hypothetical protein
MSSVEKIDQAFTQFKFAENVLEAAQAGKLDATRVWENDDVIRVARNNWKVCLGMTAVALDAAFDDANVPPDPRRLEPADDLRSVIRMIRCAFNKSLLDPKWEVRGRFERVFHLRLPNVLPEIDLRALDKKPFDLEDIGGAAAYGEIRDEARKILSKLP